MENIHVDFALTNSRKLKWWKGTSTLHVSWKLVCFLFIFFDLLLFSVLDSCDPKSQKIKPIIESLTKHEKSERMEMLTVNYELLTWKSTKQIYVVFDVVVWLEYKRIQHELLTKDCFMSVNMLSAEYKGWSSFWCQTFKVPVTLESTSMQSPGDAFIDVNDAIVDGSDTVRRDFHLCVISKFHSWSCLLSESSSIVSKSIFKCLEKCKFGFSVCN